MIRARRRGGAVFTVVMVLVSASACSGAAGEDEPPSATCSVPPSIDTPKGIPVDFPWPDGISLTQARVKKKFVVLEGFSELSVEDLFERARPELIENDFDIVNTDFEGFEAELYFARAQSLAGIVALREGPCDGFVKVNVIYDPLETAAGREAVRKTRKLSGEG